MTVTERWAADGDDWVTPSGVRRVRGDTFDGPYVIFDSDYAPDIDDVVAHGFLHGLANNEECRIAASVVSTSAAKAPGAMNALDVWHGRGDVPVGCFKGNVTGGDFDGGPLFPQGGGAGESDGANFVDGMYDNYTRTVGLASTVPDGVDVYRQALHDAADGQVTIVTVGMLTVLSQLLDSPGDAIDARDGVALVTAKVAKIVVMGTNEPDSTSSEFNMRFAPAAAANVCATSPVPLWFLGFFQSHTVITGTFNPAGSDPAAGQIVRYALEQYAFSGTENGDGRQSWDSMTVLLAVRDPTGLFASTAGTMTINASTGASSWSASSGGRDRLWTRTQSSSFYKPLINDLVFHPEVT